MLSGNIFKIPERHRINKELLNDYYIEIKELVDNILHISKSFNFIIDESTDISGHRIMNLSIIHLIYNSFFIENSDILDQIIDSRI